MTNWKAKTAWCEHQAPQQSLNSQPMPARESTGENTGRVRANRISYEHIDSVELARRWHVPVSWIREQTRRRSHDPLPHLKLGKYTRFLWNSPDLEDWEMRRIVSHTPVREGRGIGKERNK